MTGAAQAVAMSVLAAAGWGALGAASLLIGAWLALALRPSGRIVGAVMGFGAGALIAAVAYELVPAGSAGSPRFLMMGVGAVVFFVLDRLVTGRAGGARSSGRSIVLGALLDGVPESTVLGMGLATGGSVSVAFLVAVFVSNLPEALGATADLRASEPAAAIYRLWTGIVAVSAICSALGYALVQVAPRSDGRSMQAFAAGAVLTMLANSMIPEAFDEGGKVTGLLTVFGFTLAGGLSAIE
jgi:ZIP family zinc transporter